MNRVEHPFVKRLVDAKIEELFYAGRLMILAAQVEANSNPDQALDKWERGHSLVNKSVRMRSRAAGKKPPEMNPLTRDL